MLTAEEIYRTYRFGPIAVIELLEKHLGQSYRDLPLLQCGPAKRPDLIVRGKRKQR
jgi:phosphodiesterase/alkaline phosphatase D-like protein